MTRGQWYTLTVVRLLGLVVLGWAIGNWLDRASMSTLAKEVLGFVVVVVGGAIAHSWFVRYETHLEDERRRQQLRDGRGR